MDYSIVVAEVLRVPLEEMHKRHRKLRELGGLKRVQGRVIQYRKNIVKGKWIKHRNHTYYELTSEGETWIRAFEDQNILPGTMKEKLKCGGLNSVLNRLTHWRIDAQRRRNRMRSVVLLSLILHIIIAIVYLFLPLNQIAEETMDVFAVDLLNDAEAPKKRKQRPKPPLTKKMYDPNKELARDAMDRKIETARNKMDEVVKLSPRVVLEDVEVNKAPLSEIVPDVMTDAQLRDAEASNLSRLIAQPGRTDGRGVVTGRVRARGDGSGAIPWRGARRRRWTPRRRRQRRYL